MRRTSLLASAALLGGLLSVLPALPASAEEVYDRPADGVFDVEGHGWGHGRGMSQWGAQGAAGLGKTADEITSTYYPGTVRTVLPDSPIRVWLSGDEGRDTTVYPAAGLTATDAATGTTSPLPQGPSRWRVRADGAGLHLESLTGSTWTAFGPTTPGPVRFGGTTFTRVALPGGSSRDYRGSVTAVRNGSALRTVVVLGLEDYLLGVVPREASAGWRPAALQAQAIAARSYSANKRARVGGSGTYDICDTTACQVFGGSRLYTSSGSVTELEPGSTTDAVRATAGVVRSVDGTPIFSEFSSSNGGWSTDGDQPYLQAHEDPWDGASANAVHSWTAKLPVTALEKRFPGVGTLQRLRVTRRDGNGEWGGRVKEVVLEGTGGSLTTTGAGVYGVATWPGTSTGLRSTWFHVKAEATGSTVVEQSAAPSLVRPPGVSTGALTVVLRNTGTTTWPASALHLAVSSPPGQADALVGGSARPGRYTGSGDVAPGQTAAFRVDLDASGVAAGTHTRVYRARLGDGPVFGAPVTWRVPVAEALFRAARAATPVGVAAQRT
ncbi:MAG: SpoIID/LytB domain protein, partial [Frankiales bacterium]|nr:SpoIID/LytB domain protein [Frankiales bacterium]